MSLEEQVKRLTEENEKLKSQLAAKSNNEKKDEFTEKISDLSEKVDTLNAYNEGILYLETLRELRETKELLRQEIETLRQEMEERLSIIENNHVDNKSVVKETKEDKVETLDEVLEEEPEEKIEELEVETLDDPKMEEVETLDEPTNENKEVNEDNSDIPEGFIKAEITEEIDDLTYANAVKAIQNMGDPTAKKEEEEEIKVAPDAEKVETLDNSDIPILTTPSNEIEEINEPTVNNIPAIENQEQVDNQTTNLEDIVTPNVSNTVKYVDENIKAIKDFVVNRVKTITPKLIYNVRGDISFIPDNVMDSFEDNISTMSRTV